MKNYLKFYITKFKELLPFVTSTIFLIIFWETIRLILIDVFGNQNLFFPNTIEISSRVISLVFSIKSWIPIIGTFLKSLIALFIVTLISVPISFLIAKNKVFYSHIRPSWDFLRSIPPAMLFPVFIVIFGLGDSTKIVIAVYFVFLILTLNLTDSFIGIFNQDIRIWKFMNISSKHIFIYQFFPQLLDSFFSNLRISGSIIIAIIVIAEMYIGSDSGIGKALNDARNNYQWQTLYAYIILTGLVGMLLNYFIDKLHKIYKTS